MNMNSLKWSDIPCKHINYFAVHRFFVIKGYSTSYDNNENSPFNNNNNN